MAQAKLAVRGLVAGRPYRVTLGIVDAGGCDRVTLQTSDGASDEVQLYGAGLVAWSRPLLAGEDGTVRWSLRVEPWRPRDRTPESIDDRDLGIAIGEVRVEEVSGRD
jgi:hypothetical protein